MVSSLLPSACVLSYRTKRAAACSLRRSAATVREKTNHFDTACSRNPRAAASFCATIVRFRRGPNVEDHAKKSDNQPSDRST
jgi:hypothetical protein